MRTDDATVRAVGEGDEPPGGAIVQDAAALADPAGVMSRRERMLTETAQLRKNAEALLQCLLDSKARSAQALGGSGTSAESDLTGQSAVDHAIASTRRIIATYNRVIRQIRRDLTDEDLSLLDD